MKAAKNLHRGRYAVASARKQKGEGRGRYAVASARKQKGEGRGRYVVSPLERFTAKDGKEIVIRMLEEKDFVSVWKFYNKVIKETPFLARITPVRRKEEEKWFRETMDEIKNDKGIYIVAEHDGKIIGSASVWREEQETHHHCGVYGISVLQKYAGLGIGKKLSERVLAISKQWIKLEIVKLTVYSSNKIARKLYRKLGFRKAGIIPRGIKRKDHYMDDIIMYRVLG